MFFDHASVQLIDAVVGRSNNSAPRENDQRYFWCLFGVYYWRAPERLKRIRETLEKFLSQRERRLGALWVVDTTASGTPTSPSVLVASNQPVFRKPAAMPLIVAASA